MPSQAPNTNVYDDKLKMKFPFYPRVYFRCHHCAEDCKRYMEVRYGDKYRFAMVDDGTDMFNVVWFVLSCQLQIPLHMKLHQMLVAMKVLPAKAVPCLPGQITANLTWLTLTETEKKVAAGAMHRRVAPHLTHPDYSKNAGTLGALSTQLELSVPPSPDDTEESRVFYRHVDRQMWQQDMEYKLAAMKAREDAVVRARQEVEAELLAAGKV